MEEDKKIPFCARQGIGKDAAIIMLRVSPELADKIVELRKANPYKYEVIMPDGRIKYNNLVLVREASAALHQEK